MSPQIESRCSHPPPRGAVGLVPLAGLEGSPQHPNLTTKFIWSRRVIPTTIPTKFLWTA